MLAQILDLASLLFSAAIFGFFFAWICSTMWGLDTVDPRVAITSMQAVNVSVQNAVFFPAFFGTPVILGLTSAVHAIADDRTAAMFFGLAALAYILGGFLPTVAFNVPMNNALATRAVPDDIDAARAIWVDYSARWQIWNLVRTLGSGAAVILVGLGLLSRS